MTVAAAVRAALRCHLDIETYSEVDLKKCGVYVYAEHESAELLTLCYAFGQEDPICWIPLDEVPKDILYKLHDRLSLKFGRAVLIITGPTVPDRLRKHIEDGGEVGAHNAQFERVVLNGVAGRRVNFPFLRIEQMVCTAAKARMYGLPGDLGGAAGALGTYPKDDTGRNIMLKLCRPRTGKEKRHNFEEHGDDYVHLYAYCVDDVLAERGLDERLGDLPPTELDVWRLDQRINDRGVGVDQEIIEHVQALIAEYKELLGEICIRMTKCDQFPDGLRPSQNEKLSIWIRANGYPQLLDMQAETVLKIQKDANCPDNVKKLLRLYSTVNMKAVTKYDAIQRAVARDGRVHGMFMYYGAGTGRWSSLIVQLQNLFRPLIDDADVAIEAFKFRNLQWIRELYPDLDPMKVFASCVRGSLIPADGDDFMGLDFAGIESRKVAWLYDEEWKVQAFFAADRDPKMPDNYRLAYGRGFGIDPMSISKKDPRRQVGKVMELAFGFEGGAAACVTMADTYRVDLAEMTAAALPNLPEHARESAEWMWENWECKRGNPTELPYNQYIACDGLKQIWRGLHPCIQQGWKDTAEAAKLAVLHPGQAYAIPNKKLIFKVVDQWLMMKLPSGRRLYYFKPELHEDTPKAKFGAAMLAAKIKEDTLEGLAVLSNEEWVAAAYADNGFRYINLTFMGVDSRTKQWKREGTYGGKLCENAAQASSRDLLVNGMFKLEKAGYFIVMTVHDEIVVEISEMFGSMVEAERLMCELPAWAAGMPMAAEGFRGKRYRK